jgi:cobalt-zinc-cadmium efflux system protein
MHDHAPGVRSASNRRLLATSLAITTVVLVV